MSGLTTVKLFPQNPASASSIPRPGPSVSRGAIPSADTVFYPPSVKDWVQAVRKSSEDLDTIPPHSSLPKNVDGPFLTQTLDLGDNPVPPLPSLPGNVEGPFHVQAFDLDNNQFTELTVQIFNDLVEMQVLDLITLQANASNAH